MSVQIGLSVSAVLAPPYVSHDGGFVPSCTNGGAKRRGETEWIGEKSVPLGSAVPPIL